LATPQWIGEPGVDAVIILSIDDMTETRRYETFLRPLLERLKQIDGRTPVSIMTRSVPVEDPQVQAWLKEGLSLEVHTLNHPCPLLANGDFNAAQTNVFGCIDLLNRVPGNKPVAFRMPCCDSMDSTSPRFFCGDFQRSDAGGAFSDDRFIGHEHFHRGRPGTASGGGVEPARNRAVCEVLSGKDERDNACEPGRVCDDN
jgi:hypothetical protein